MTTEHDRRVTELLEANNREVEKRREVQRELDGVRAAISLIIDGLLVHHGNFHAGLFPALYALQKPTKST